MESFTHVVDAVKKICETELSPTAYHLWIEPLEAVELNEQAAILYLNRLKNSAKRSGKF